MRYTQAQLREAVGLSLETVRHWRKVLTPLRRKTGHAALFSFGDLVALAILRSFVDDLGIPIGRFSAHADRLFALCNATPWHQLEDCVACVHRDGIDLQDHSGVRSSATRVCAVVDIGSITTKLRRLLLDGRDTELQLRLRFPPAAVQRPRMSPGIERIAKPIRKARRSGNADSRR